jgi:predicted rRNA methylase YqxC with S4 and FtsJ domains
LYDIYLPCLLDLSYLSLTTALPLATRLLAPPGHIIALVKPLFEVASVQARRSGRIEDPVLVRDALRQVIATGEGCGLVVQGVVKLALQPRHGVHEFVIVFGQDVGGAPGVVDLVTLEAIIAGEGIGRRVED